MTRLVRRLVLSPLWSLLILLILTSCRAEISLPNVIPTFSPSAVPSDVPPALLAPTSRSAPITSPTLTPLPNLPPTATPIPVSPPITPANVALLQPVLILDGHQGMVKGVAVSADGKLIASGSSDWKVRLFDGISGEVLHIMEHHRDWVYSVDFSPDGRFLVSGGRDRAVQLWDTDSGERVTGVRTTAELYRVDFSPDGTRFAGAGFYSAIGHVWNLDGAEVFPLEGHTTRLRTVAYSQEGGWLGTADGEGLVLIRDAATGEPLYQAQVSGEALALAFLRGTNWLAVGTSRGEVVIFDVESGEVIQSWFAHSAGIGEVIASPDGALLISAGPDAAVRLWDPESGVRLASLSGHGVAVNGVAISSDGSTLVSGGNDGRVFVWRVGSSP